MAHTGNNKPIRVDFRFSPSGATFQFLDKVHPILKGLDLCVRSVFLQLCIARIYT